jgi:hypothetical protein
MKYTKVMNEKIRDFSPQYKYARREALAINFILSNLDYKSGYVSFSAKEFLDEVEYEYRHTWELNTVSIEILEQTLNTLKKAAKINTTCYATNTLYYEPGGTLVGVLISKELCDFIKQMECDDRCQELKR